MAYQAPKIENIVKVQDFEREALYAGVISNGGNGGNGGTGGSA